MIMTSERLIRSTKKKFAAFSIVGVSLVCLLSLFVLNFQKQNLSNQTSMQELYLILGDQFKLVSEISLVSERFEVEQEVAELLKTEASLNELVINLDKRNIELLAWIEENDSSQVEKIEDILNEKKTQRKMFNYIQKAKELSEANQKPLVERKKLIKYLTQSASGGIGEVLGFASQKLITEQKRSLGRLEKIGFLLVGFCLAMMFCVWIFIFRPLYLVILNQHESLSNALLSSRSASRSKTDFLANISHEIRTPMTAIMGYADILKRENISKAEKDDATNVINQNANHLIALIDEILDISKIEAGKFDFENEEIDLSTLLNEVYSLIHVKSQEKKLDLVFKNSGKIPETIQSDPKRLKQILFNILGNAIKFTNEGHVVLVVSFDEKNNYLRIKVKDSGKGISKEQRQKLFKPFEQGDSSVSREYGGTGLGLVLSRGMAEGMGGNISILDSEIGKGTTFEILIKVGDRSGVEMVNKFSTSIIEDDGNLFDEKALLGKKILVVDDAKENARLFQMYLSQVGAEVEVANNGTDAIRLVDNIKFDLVLLDLQMPGKDGFQVIKEIRANLFVNPVVALTAHAMKEEKLKTKEAGFNEHITKPVRQEVLIKIIKSLI